MDKELQSLYLKNGSLPVILILLAIASNYDEEGNYKGLSINSETENLTEYLTNNLGDNLYQGLDQLKDILNEEEYQNLLNLDFIKELGKIKTKKSVN